MGCIMRLSKIILSATVAVMALSAPAFAKDGHGKGRGSDDSHEYEVEHHKSSGHEDDGMTTIRIGDDDRSYIHHYLEDSYKRDCPPGLAKKHNGCLPPGQAKRYTIGYRLPDDVIWAPVPSDILEHLRPAPAGYKYVKVDTDILLIGEASKKVIDAVTLLSGVGNQ